MSVGDVYYVLFRHKWKILLLSLTGIAAAAAFYHFNPPPYQSQAELMIQYVPVPTAVTLPGSDKITVADSGVGIINSEIQILTSFDLAKQAATNFGPAGILASFGGGSNAIAAASIIQGNLEVTPVGGGSSDIMVTFRHPDRQVVQPILDEVINGYFDRQKAIHSSGNEFDQALLQAKDALSVQLNDTDKQLADLKNGANIISLDDARKGLSDRIAKIQSAMLDADTGLAVAVAAIKREGAGALDEKQQTTNTEAVIPQDQIDAYNNVCVNLGGLHKREQDYYLQGFAKSNALVMEVVGQIANAQKAKADLEQKYPQIAGLGSISTATGGQAETPAQALHRHMQDSEDIQAKLKAWNQQLGKLQMDSTNLNNLEIQIAQLERVKAIEQAQLQILSEGIEKDLIKAALDTKAPNIKSVQSPSPPVRDWKKTRKITAMIAFGGIFAGLALAFLIEFVLDRSVKRPVEIEAKLKVPLFLSIPDFRRNGHSRLVIAAEQRRLQLPNATEADAPAGGSDPVPGKNGALQVVSLESNPALHPFCEALRDRLIVYFEVNNLTHKPKLVAVTSAGHGAGVSSIAAGLAASLSETGDGNVLLVDMNIEQGAAQQFYKGKAGCGLDTALTAETKQDALVQENLYVVNGNAKSAELPGILPKRFAALVPRLKASDYDYIIFDMPPVSQTSLTSRLSRFMDMVLLVVESEKTGREVVQQANTWLAESGATVGVVLNKTRQYVPERLHQEFLGDK